MNFILTFSWNFLQNGIQTVCKLFDPVLKKSRYKLEFWMSENDVQNVHEFKGWQEINIIAKTIVDKNQKKNQKKLVKQTDREKKFEIN